MDHPIQLELLFADERLPRFELPEPLERAYGGSLGFSLPRVVANFVSSVDGLVTLPGSDESGHLINGGSDDSAADRLVMALLRACADVVLVGAGTFRKTPGALWTAAAAFPDGPDAEAHFAALRKNRGQPPAPPLALISASGELPLEGPALDDAILFTTPAGEARLRGHTRPGTRVRVLDPGPIHLDHVLESLRADGLPLILTEGGPSLMGQLVAEDLVDELFVTSAPALFGRSPGDGRKSLIDGVHLNRQPLELTSARRAGSHLFLRYLVTRS